METPSPSLPLTRRHLMLLWLCWTVATMVSFTIGWSTSLAWFPWQSIPETPNAQRVAYFFEGIPAALWLGLAQYVILRVYIRRVKWVSLLVVSVLGHSIGYGVVVLSSYSNSPASDLFYEPRYWSFLGYQEEYAPLYGLIVGVLQAPVLWVKLKSRRWWLWPVPCAIASTLAGIAWARMQSPVNPRYVGILAEGAVYGLITGFGLVLLLRGTTIPPVNEEAPAS